MTTINSVLFEVYEERQRQDERWGVQNHPVHFGPAQMTARHALVYQKAADDWKKVNAERVAERNKNGIRPDCNAAWDGILLEEVYEALAETDPARQRAELLQVAAVAVAAIERLDRGV